MDRRLRRDSAPIQHTDVRERWHLEADRFIREPFYPCAVSGSVETGGKQPVAWSRALNLSDSQFNETKAGAGELLRAYGAVGRGSSLPLVAKYATGRFRVERADLGTNSDVEAPQRDIEAIRQRLEAEIRSRRSPERSDGYAGAMSGGGPWDRISDWWMAEVVRAKLAHRDTTSALDAAGSAVQTLLDIPTPPRASLEQMQVLLRWTRARRLCPCPTSRTATASPWPWPWTSRAGLAP